MPLSRDTYTTISEAFHKERIRCFPWKKIGQQFQRTELSGRVFLIELMVGAIRKGEISILTVPQMGLRADGNWYLNANGVLQQRTADKAIVPNETIERELLSLAFALKRERL